MELLTIHEHTVCMDLLPTKAIICDLGASGFEFTNYFRELGRTVHAVDVQELYGDYDRIAIADYDGTCGVKLHTDPQAISTITYNGLSNHPSTWQIAVPCCTLEAYMKSKGVEMYDLIKCDIEGGEYAMIMSLAKPPAKQISVEFHLHTGVYTEKAVTGMVYHLSTLGYEAVRHKKEDKHCAGFNYWDSLFILKNA